MKKHSTDKVLDEYEICRKLTKFETVLFNINPFLAGKLASEEVSEFAYTINMRHLKT